jgi:hypothetical protein
MFSLSSSSAGQPSLVDWLMGTLETSGAQTLDQLSCRLPDTNWAQLMLAVDYLSRNGQVSLELVARGDYLVCLNKAGVSIAFEEPHTELAGATTVGGVPLH